MNILKNDKKKQFRLRGKKLTLTYSQVNLKTNENIKILILKQLSEKLSNIKQYIIAEEKHEDGGTHFHCYFEFNQSIKLYGANCLDLIFNEKTYHGKYEIVRNKNSIINYITKHNDFIAEPELSYLDGELFLNFKDYLLKLYEKGGLGSVKNHLLENKDLNNI